MIRNKTTLMKRMLKRAARARREHGIALLFTLCILSMALITAMIFSSNASTGRKVAAAHVDTSAARILADGVVNRAILALMQSDNASYVCSNYNTAKPKNGNANEYASDWIWKLEKSGLFEFNNGPLRFRNSTYYDREDSRCPSWEYVFSKNGYGDSSTSTERIYGRYAYVAIGQNDYLNPNAIGNREKVDDGAAFEKRLGRYTCEPQFIFKSTRNNWDYSSLISQEKLQDKYPGSDGWTDIDVFVDDMAGSGGPAAADKQLKMMVDQYFDLSGAREYNKFRADGKEISDLTKEPGSDESYRFPLIRSDWESVTVATVKSEIPWFGNPGSGINVNQVDQTVANLINYNASVNRSPVTDNDNWFSGEPKYTGNKRTPYINEVYADVSVGGHLGTAVRRIEWTADSPPQRQFWVKYIDCSYNHEISIDVETVNLYADPVFSVGNPILIGEISYQYLNPSADSWIPQTVRFDAGTQWAPPVITTSGNYTVYRFVLKDTVGSVTTPEELCERPTGNEGRFYKYIKVKDVRLSLDRVVLQDGSGRNADLSLMPSQLQTGRTFPDEAVVASAGDSSRRFFFGTQANDPRQNLNASRNATNEWSNPAFSETEAGVNATIGSFNNTVNYNKNDTSNFDPGEDPGNNAISTAYIRHEQMQSLWELGAVHRGAPWQTINLKCAPANGNGMDTYQKGDGHLLDQIALTTQDRIQEPVLGLINLNCVASFGGSSAPFAFKALFTKFPLYQTFENMNKSGSSGKTGTIGDDSKLSIDSDSTDADDCAKDLSEAVTYALKQGYLPRRTAVFPTQYPASGSQMEHIIKKNVNDAEAEEIFCRVVNLLKWNKQPLKRATVLVLAQTIKDVGGATSSQTVQLERVISDNRDDEVLYDAGFRAFSSSSRVIRDMDAGQVRSTYRSRPVSLKQYDNFYDQITGESKIIVRLEWDESANDNKGAWKVTRKEYAE